MRTPWSGSCTEPAELLATFGFMYISDHLTGAGMRLSASTVGDET